MNNLSINNNTSSTFFILAGEQSADNHGAILMHFLKKLKPNAEFAGIGGKKMADEGLISIEDINKLAVMGFVEVIRHLLFFRKLTVRVLEEIQLIKPIHIILIDYPGFNLRLAKKIKLRFDIPITYYISPKLWAWKENRIEIIQKYIDQMLVIFPFEKNWYKNRGVDVKFVGHPIFDEWKPAIKHDLCNGLGLNPDKPILTLFPGSRKQELSQHLSLFISVAEKLRTINSQIQFVLGIVPEMSLDHFQMPDWIRIERDCPQHALECADLALVASGSATLEAAVFGTPTLIIYKMAILSWWLSKLLIKTDYAGIVNIIAGKKIMPEFLQNDATSESITNKALEIINSREKQEQMKSDMFNVKQKLNGMGASQRVAQHILSFTKSK